MKLSVKLSVKLVCGMQSPMVLEHAIVVIFPLSLFPTRRLGEWHPVMGVQQIIPRGVWTPTALCIPLGALAHAHAHGVK